MRFKYSLVQLYMYINYMFEKINGVKLFILNISKLDNMYRILYDK